MDEKLRDYMEAAIGTVLDANLNLFIEYHRLAEQYKKEGNTEAHQYWHNRELDINNAVRKLRNDIRTLEKGCDLNEKE